MSKKLDEIVDFAGVEQFIDTPVKRYSSGMYVRLGFAVAAHLDPDILVVDEVLAVGDASFRKKALGKMKDVSKGKGRTVLFVSHNMKSIKDLCKRTVLLERGELVSDGRTEDVINEYITDKEKTDLIPEVKFEPNPNTLYQISAIRILNHNGKISPEIDRTTPFRVEIDYAVRNKNRNVSIEFSLRSPDGTHIYHGADTDLAPDQLIERKEGNYTTFVEFPGYLLNAGIYKIIAWTRWAGRDYDFPSKQPIFYLNDYGTYASGPNVYVVDKNGQRRGVLAMPLTWETKELN